MASASVGRMFDDVHEIETGGILPAKWLRAAVQANVVCSDYTIPEENYQPASLDLRLGEKAYSLQCSFLPFPGTVERKLRELTISEIDIRDGAILERNRPYLIPLLEGLDLPTGVRARTNPKSSTGRLDIFTRVITDNGARFDDITDGYSGPMYLEVFSRTFTIKVRTELSLNQIRLFKGESKLAPGCLQAFHESKPIIYSKSGQPEPIGGNSLELSVDLDTRAHIGYRAKRNSKLLDLSRINHYHPKDFWEPVFAERDRPLILEPEEFYLLSSDERVSIPPGLAAEMAPYEASSGEIRTHYAGFFDPGFGYGENGRLNGVQAVLEVRAHDVPFMIGPAQKVCTLTFERMLEPPQHWYGVNVGSSYQKAGRILSKHFSPNVTSGQPNIVEGR